MKNSRIWRFHVAVATIAFVFPTTALFSLDVQNKDETKQAGQPADAPPAIVESLGWLLAREMGVAGVEIDDGEITAFIKGFSANTGNQPPPWDFRAIYPDVEKLAKERRKKLMLAAARHNEAQAETFFRELKGKPDLVGMPGGVWCEILAPGQGELPKLKQTVTIHYVARLIDGREFMQFGPIDVVLVPERRVFPRWAEAVPRLRKGGAMKLYVPPPLSEEDAANWGIEPGSAMIFEIELLDIKDTSPEALEAALAGPPPDAPPPPSGLSDLELIQAWGWSVAQQSGVSKLGLTEREQAALAKGMIAGIKNQPAPGDLPQMQPVVEEFVARRREHARQAVRQKQRAEIAAFFSGLKSNPNIADTPSGLRYEIVRRGDGPPPKPGQIVLVDYTGRLVDGTVFDRTDNEPLNVEVGGVIAGWNEGIQLIGRGGKIKLYIPPELGYKDLSLSGHLGPIPPGSALIYEIELLEIKDTLPGP